MGLAVFNGPVPAKFGDPKAILSRDSERSETFGLRTVKPNSRFKKRVPRPPFAGLECLDAAVMQNANGVRYASVQGSAVYAVRKFT